MAKYDRWILKSKRGSFVPYFMWGTRKGVIVKIGWERWDSWKAQGYKIVKIKLVEVA